jgi:hypothetical protein
MADQPIDPNGQSIDPNAPAQVAQTESPVSRAPPGDQTEQEALASANASAPVTFLEQLRNLCLRSNGETNRYPSLAFKDQFHDRPVAQPGAVVGLPKIVRSGENDIKGDNPVFALDAKIFIQGIEISPFVSGAISVSRTNVNGHSTCTFTITNQADQFIWTEANLRALYGESKPSVQRAVKAQLAGGVATEAATKRADALIAASQVSTFTAAEHLKKKLYGFKANRLVNKRIRDPQGIPFFTRYDLRPNSCIFNKMDPIRVFVKYPYRIGDTSKLGTTELWMP